MDKAQQTIMATVEKTKKQPKKAGQATWFSRHAHLLVIAAFTFLLYANMLGNGYNLDDELVTINHRLTSQGISAIPEIFTSPYYQDNMGYAYEYRPVVLTTFAIEHQFFGESPFMGHVISLLLYIGLCILLYKFLLQLGGVVTPPLALFITLLFSAFTAHTEVVCSIKNRDELLGLLFSLSAARYALLAARSDKWWLVLAVPFFYLLAILSKITFLQFSLLIPLLLLLFEKKGFVYILLLTAALGGLTYGFLDVNPARYKLWYMVSLLGSVTVLYGVVRGFSIKNLIQQIRESNSGASTGSNELFGGLKPWLQSFEIYHLYIVAVVLAVLALDYFWLRNTIYVVPLVGVIFLGSVFLAVKRVGYWSFGLGMMLLAAVLTIELLTASYALWRYNQLPFQIYFLYLVFVFYWGKKTERLPALVMGLFTLLFLSSDEVIGFVQLLVIICFTRLTIGKKAMPIIFALMGLGLVIGNISSLNADFFNRFDFVPLFMVAVVASLVFWSKGIAFWRTNGQWLIGLYVLSLTPAFIPQFSSYNLNRVIIQVNTDNDALNVVNTVVKQKTDRPLQYIEFPMPQNAPLALKAGTAFVIMQHYLQKTIAPYPLSFYYGYAYIVPVMFDHSSALFGLAVHLALLFVALVLLRFHPFLAFALFIYLATVVIYSGLFMSVPGIVADRYMLVSSLGWCMLLGYGLFYVIERYLAKKTITYWASVSTPARILILLPLMIYAGLTFSRNFDWKDRLTLMRKDVQFVTNSAQAHNLLGLNIMKYATGNALPPAEQNALFLEAATHFKQSFQIYPKTFNVVYDIGRVYAGMNNLDSAILYFQKASELDTMFPDLFLNLGELNLAQGNLTQAIPYYAKYTDLTPNKYDGYSKWSYVYFKLNDFDSSIAVNQKAIANLPGNIDPFINIANTYMAMNKNDSARVWLLKADEKSNGNNQNVKALLNKIAP